MWHENDGSHAVQIKHHFDALKVGKGKCPSLRQVADASIAHLQGHAIQDPITGVRLYNLLISWYSTLQVDLNDYGKQNRRSTRARILTMLNMLQLCRSHPREP